MKKNIERCAAIAMFLTALFGQDLAYGTAAEDNKDTDNNQLVVWQPNKDNANNDTRMVIHKSVGASTDAKSVLSNNPRAFVRRPGGAFTDVKSVLNNNPTIVEQPNKDNANNDTRMVVRRPGDASQITGIKSSEIVNEREKRQSGYDIYEEEFTKSFNLMFSTLENNFLPVAKSKVQQLIDLYLTTRNELETAKKRETELQKELEILRSSHEQENAKFKSEHENQSKEVQKYRGRKDEYKTQLQNSNQSNILLTEEKRKAESAIREIQTNLQTKEDELQKIQDEVKKAQDELKSTKIELESTKKEAYNTKKWLEAKIKEQKKLSDEKNKLTKEKNKNEINLNKAKGSLGAISEESKQMKEINDQLREQLKNAYEEKQKLENQLLEARSHAYDKQMIDKKMEMLRGYINNIMPLLSKIQKSQQKNNNINELSRNIAGINAILNPENRTDILKSTSDRGIPKNVGEPVIEVQ